MRLSLCLLLAMLGLVGIGASAPQTATTQSAQTTSASQPGGKVSDEAVEAAIRKGIAFLLKQQRDDGSWPADGDLKDAPTAAALYALIQAGYVLEYTPEPAKNCNPLDKNISKALEWLKKNKTDSAYSVGLRCLAWMLANRQMDKYVDELGKDVKRLQESPVGGSSGKDDGKGVSRNYDSFYALLGLWAAQMGHVEVDDKYWAETLEDWNSVQRDDGSWAYPDRSQTGSAMMTVAGLTAVYVCSGMALPVSSADGKVSAEPPSIGRGLTWLGHHLAEEMAKAQTNGELPELLFALERLSPVCGYKYFGDTDWYKTGAKALLETQQASGGWGGKHGDATSTAMAVLFLTRGRHPVVMGKLQHSGDWNNRPQAVANYVRRLEATIECADWGSFDWQIVSFGMPVEDWLDTPILVISGSKELVFRPAELDKLRQYVLQGGMIWSVPECDSQAFTNSMRKTYRLLFPNYNLMPVGPGHEIYSVYLRAADRGKLFGISNGVRMLAFHSTGDMTMPWQTNSFRTQRWAYELGANIYLYVTDRKSVARPRGCSLWPDESVTPTTTGSITLARLKTNGNFDPEPLAYKRFSLLMARLANVEVKVEGPVDIGKLAQSKAKIATITGTDRFTLSADDKAALKAFVAGGGTLFMDAAGGNRDFTGAAQELASELWGADSLKALPLTSPIYKPANEKLAIETVRYRRKSLLTLGKNKEPQLKAVLINDRPAVIFSREDVTAGLVGYPCFAIDGYYPGDGKDAQRSAGDDDTKLGSAFRIMRNIVLFADRQQVAPASAPAQDKQ